MGCFDAFYMSSILTKERKRKSKIQCSGTFIVESLVLAAPPVTPHYMPLLLQSLVASVNKMRQTNKIQIQSKQTCKAWGCLTFPKQMNFWKRASGVYLERAIKNVAQQCQLDSCNMFLQEFMAKNRFLQILAHF